uniref:Uncharacterized protein n=1 Tax=Oryza meridionalis TaxID=40149 RepID=A0A0E0C9G2_9ORYZ
MIVEFFRSQSNSLTSCKNYLVVARLMVHSWKILQILQVLLILMTKMMKMINLIF